MFLSCCCCCCGRRCGSHNQKQDYYDNSDDSDDSDDSYIRFSTSPSSHIKSEVFDATLEVAHTVAICGVENVRAHGLLFIIGDAFQLVNATDEKGRKKYGSIRNPTGNLVHIKPKLNIANFYSSNRTQRSV